MLLTLALSCRPQPVSLPEPAPAAHQERLAFWRGVAADGPPDGADLDPLVDELVSYLRSPDAELRDGVAYGILAGWIEDRLPAETLRRLVPVLTEGLAATGDDAVFGRSFSALVLASLVARDRADPFLDDAGLASLVADAAAYAAREDDLRGYVDDRRGWAHAAAHTADWLRQLAMHPRLPADQATAIAEAVLALTVRRHGAILHHGEDGRLAQPILELLRRERLDPAAFATWVEALAAPLHERGGATHDAGLYAAQRNARNLLFTLFVALSLEEAPNATCSAALASLTATISG